MRLSIVFLLVTLALCCYQANAKVCPALPQEFTQFLMGDKDTYKILLQSYNPPPEVVEAKMELKKCVDQITLEHKLLLTNILRKIVVECDS